MPVRRRDGSHDAPPGTSPLQYAKQNGLKFELTGNLQAMWKAFDSIDTDHGGSISSHELADVLKAMGTRATAEELADMVGVLDQDNTNAIE